jgi:hypothetical protein
MRLNKIFLALTLITISVVMLFYAEYPSKIYRYTQQISDEYLPKYSESYLKDFERENKLETGQEIFNSVMEHLNPDSLDLTLTKIPIEETFENDKSFFHIIKYRANFLNLIKKASEIGTAYIDFYQDKILIVQENGLFFSVPKNEIAAGNENITATKIKTNISKYTNYLKFYAPGKFGIKDIMVFDNQIFVSFIREVSANCFNVSVITAQININLDFKILYSPESCIEKNFIEFNAEQTGGRMVPFINNKILLSTGDFRKRDNAQNLTNNFGKILSLDLSNGESQIISYGHRNPQGLYFSKKFNEIWSTEHGPFGGDEINFNNSFAVKTTLNFGWPQASYGAHYGAGEYLLKANGYELIENRDFPAYQSSPLYKSHSQHGFSEPIIQLTPSVGISQISEVSNSYSQVNAKRSFIVGTMGYSSSKFIPSVSMLIFSFDEKNKLLPQDQIIMNERMRDLIYDQESQATYFSGDLGGVIGILSPKKIID